jgi:hypothetical protein
MRLMAQSPQVNLFHPGKDLGPGIVIQEFRHCLPVNLRPFPGGENLPFQGPGQEKVFIPRRAASRIMACI